MDSINKNITIELLLQSLEDDFNKQERALILYKLKNSSPTDDTLLGAKLLLEQNNWDYTVLKNAFSKAETRIDKLASENAKPKIKAYYLKYAAVLVPIALLSGYFISQFGSVSIDDYYIEEVGLPSLMSTEKTDWDDLMQLYKSNQFEKAFALSEKIKIEKPNNDTLTYFQAVIAYNLKKYAVAKISFEKVIKNKKSAFYAESEFRMGFALEHLNQNQESIGQFERVRGNLNNPYNEEVIKVLKILKK